MKTYDVEGIGSLELNQTASLVSSLLKALRGISFAVGGVLGYIAWTMSRNRMEIPLKVSVPGVIGMLAGFAFWFLQLFAMRRLYYPGDWYKLLEHSARSEGRDSAHDPAHALIKLTGTDLLTCKLRAKAHLYLAYHLPPHVGAGHWGPLVSLLNSILEQEPRNAVFRLDRAQAYQHLKKYDEALKDLEIPVADMEHPSLRAHSIKISCLTSTNRLDEARLECEILERFIWRFPDQSAVTQAISAHRAQILERARQRNDRGRLCS
jgi:hypothetical protein